MAEIVWTDPALNDLEEMAEYIALDKPEAAEKFDWSFNDADLPVDTWKVMMYSEILGKDAGLRRHFN